MLDLKIVPYTVRDNEFAIELEGQCVQGKKLVLKFLRPTFHARSEVYEKYRILCAKEKNRLIGIAAWSEKSVTLHGKSVKVAYLYDLRVHPDYRKHGIALRIIKALCEDIGPNIECIYTLIAGENERALGLARRIYGLHTEMPLTYAIIPVYKKFREEEGYRFTNASEVHEEYLTMNPDVQFIPAFDETRLPGYVSSIVLQKGGGGCSIWTNENLLKEQVVSIPLHLRILSTLTKPLRLFLKLPYIPQRGETIRSWFLFDFYAANTKSARNLLTAVNNIALNHDRTFLYLLLQSNNPILEFIRESGKVYTIPYFFLAKGQNTPSETESIYIDIRDL